MIRSLAIVCLFASLAHADKPASLAHYNKGKQAYAAGNFALAVAEFEAAYAQWNTPEYLHDIGQAYRRLDRCNEAATSFERYLVAKPNAANRATVTELIHELRAKCPAQIVDGSAKAEPAKAEPPKAEPPKAEPAKTEPAVAPKSEPRAVAAKSEPAAVAAKSGPAAVAAPAGQVVPATTTLAVSQRAPLHTTSPWHPTAVAGIVMLDAGPVVMPPIPELAVGVLRDMHLPFDLQLGANLSVARLPFDDLMTGTVWLAGPEVVASASRPLHTHVALFGAVATGVQLVSGLSTGNPFTDNGTSQDSFVTLRLRGELGVAWRASERLSVRVAPGYQYSPRRAALADDIHALHGFALHAGVALDL
ncbi:MAG TPA: hypothetical protein VIV40_39740 [Kofleriaceae bacterium]